MKPMKAIGCVMIALICLALCCCQSKSPSLTSDYKRSGDMPVYDFYAEESGRPESYDKFAKAYSDFAAKMLINANTNENGIYSPYSLYTAMALTANGSAGKTLQNMENVMGDPLRIADINLNHHYLSSRLKALNNDGGKLTSANSLWINDSFSVKSQYLQTVVNYYDAEVFRTKLAENGVSEINSWISKNTAGEIKDMISSLNETTQAVLVNALLFDDEWVTPYNEAALSEGTFNGTKGSEDADFMTSNEMFISSADAKGFIKSYKNTPCKFVAILPNEDVSLEEYISSLSGQKLDALLNSQSGLNRCFATIPQFELRTKLSLKSALQSMGMDSVFSEDANFSALTMNEGLCVSDVLQESFIKVTPQGTKAGSATAVIMDSAAIDTDFEELIFNRPFLFMIVENEYNLPLFIGTVNSLG